jgi:hypothetical protein
MRRVIIALATATALSMTLVSAPAVLADEFVDDDVVVEFAPASSEPKKRSQASRITREAQHARGSKAAADLRGYEKSLYRGKYYMPNREQVRRCIMKRESRHNYKAISRGGLWRGAYQMSKPLARGATWEMTREVRKEMGAEGVAILKKLRKTSIHKWNRYWQDRAFWTIWDKGKGKHHWRGGGRNCFNKR